jgi:hypothetical protein
METRKLKISKETANRWYNGSDTELKQLALQTFPELAEKELPKSWEEAQRYTNTSLERYTNISLDKFVALARLEILRDIYNDGWVADWTDNAEGKHCVWFFKNEIATDCSYSLSSFLAFKDAKTRDLFLENFRDLILTAKPLL